MNMADQIARPRMRTRRWDQAPTIQSQNAQLSSLLAQKGAVETKVQDLEDQLARLKARETALNAQYSTVSLAVARQLCGAFALKFHAALPAEIRDLVYAHVWDDATLDRMFDNVCEDPLTVIAPAHAPGWENSSCRSELLESPWASTCAGGASCDCFQWYELPMWLQHQFVGVEVAQEAAASYYRSVHPIRYSTMIYSLEGLLSNDHFHLGVVPFQHVRRLKIAMGKHTYLPLRGDLACYDSTHPTQTEWIIPALLKIRVKSGFHLTLETTWNGELPDGLIQLDRMRAVLKELQAADAKVTITAFHDRLQKSYDISDLLVGWPDLPQWEWEKQWRARVRKDLKRKRREDRKRSPHADENGEFNFDSVDLNVYSELMEQYMSHFLGHDEDSISSISGDLEDELGEGFYRAPKHIGASESMEQNYDDDEAFMFEDEEFDDASASSPLDYGDGDPEDGEVDTEE